MANEDLLPIFAQLAGEAQAEEIQDELTAIQSWYAALVPGADVRDPVLTSLLLMPIAARQAWFRRLVAVARQYALPDAVLLGDITDAQLQSDLQAAQLDILGLTEQTATAAVGELDLVFTSAINSLAIATGTEFTSGSLTAFTERGWIIRLASRAQNDENEILLRQVDNVYVATLPVVMSTAGIVGNVPAGTEFSWTLDSPELESVQASVAFAGGSDGYAASDVLSAYVDGLFEQTLGTRDQIVAFIRQHPELGDIRQVGVIGYGDGEMHRDKTTFAPIGGSAADLYLAFGNPPPSRTVQLSGTRIQVDDTPKYQYTIGVSRDTAPGFYRVLAVRDTASGKLCEIVSVTRGLDLTEIEGEAIPQLTETSHGVFSRFQSATLLVAIEANADIVGSSRTFEVVLEYHPGLAIAQSIVAERGTRFVGGDTLVRACIPLFVTITIRFEITGGETLPDELLLTQAILAEIYRAPCRATLYQSDLIRAMSPYLRDAVAVQRIDYHGELLKCDGETLVVSGQQDLRIPSDASQQLSSRTIALVTDASQIKFEMVQLVSVEAP